MKRFCIRLFALMCAVTSLCANEEQTTLLLIRHTETDWNAEPRRYSGRTNLPLNDRGMAQAEQLATYVANNHSDISSIYSSTLDRAYVTAQKVAEALGGLPILQRYALREMDWGIAEGCIVEEIDPLRQIDHLEENHKQKWDTPVFPESETYNELLLRTENELKDIAQRHPGKKVAVFTHGRVIRTLIVESLNHPETVNYLPNGAIAHFLFTPEKSGCPFTFAKVESPFERN